MANRAVVLALGFILVAGSGVWSAAPKRKAATPAGKVTATAKKAAPKAKNAPKAKSSAKAKSATKTRSARRSPKSKRVVRRRVVRHSWISHYLEPDRRRIRGGIWGVTSTETDKYYHRPQCYRMIQQPAGIVIGFAQPYDATEAGYVPCGMCRPSIQVSTPYSPEGRELNKLSRPEVAMTAPSFPTVGVVMESQVVSSKTTRTKRSRRKR